LLFIFLLIFIFYYLLIYIIGKGPEEDLTPTITKEEAVDKATALVPNAFQLLGDKNWKQKLAGIEELGKSVETMQPDDISANSEALVLALSVKPGWKEANFQVLSNTFLVIGKLALIDPHFSRRTAGVAMEGM
jgi:cytoskeleton-associated protein 5